MSLDDTIKMPDGVQSQVLAELKKLTARLTSLEEKVQSANLDLLRADFAKHHKDVVELIGDLDRKFDVISRELLQVKADQLKVDKRLTEIESEVRPNVIPQDRHF